MSHTARSDNTANPDEVGDALARGATSAVAEEFQDIRDSGTERVADKQLFRWKDDGGALPPHNR